MVALPYVGYLTCKLLDNSSKMSEKWNALKMSSSEKEYVRQDIALNLFSVTP